jgi:prepilin-type N-terminal cleavage/methylation domain-containing protein
MRLLRRHSQHRGFTTIELLLAMAIGALVIGAAAVAYGTLTRNMPKGGNAATITLDAARMTNYYGLNQTTIQAVVAPNYGAALRAESMRERFLSDVMTATAVFPIARTAVNPYRPASIAFDPLVDTFPDTPKKFRDLIVGKGLVSSSIYLDKRNYDDTSPNCTVFILGYSSDPTVLAVNAIYDIDVDKVNNPKGFYASVKRFVNLAGTGAGLTDYYDIYYPPYDGTLWPTTADKFAPLWVSFERQSRKNITPPESTDIERFKVAREKPFHLIWWPDPAAPTLGIYRASNSAYAATDPRRIYNHMAGRTSFMFTVPEFPSY